MFWQIVWGSILFYSVVGVLCLTTLTRDEYRRQRMKTPEKPEQEVRSQAATQGWANALFWPIYLQMHFSQKALDKIAKEEELDQKTQQILGELQNPEGWDRKFRKEGDA